MEVLVSDTSVIIDLERSGLLKNAFSLAVEFVVPDILFERELRHYGGDALLELGLRIADLAPAGVEQAQVYFHGQKILAMPDCFALSLARSQGWILLSGDGPLRAMANRMKVECHGVLWLLDLMESEAVITGSELHAGLSRLAAHPRCRLPTGEIEKRLRRYKANAC